MLETVEKRRLLVIGMVIVVLSIMSLMNNLLQVDWQIWIVLVGLGLSLVILFGAYLLDKELYAIISAYVILAVFLLIALAAWWASFEGAIVPTYIMVVIALPFAFVGLTNRRLWGMLIPAYVLLAIIPIFYMGENTTPELIPAYVLTAIAVPFLVVFFLSRQWGWLIPSAVLLLIAISFLGMAWGMPTAYMNIGLPVVALLIGIFLLLRAMMQGSDKQEDL